MQDNMTATDAKKKLQQIENKLYGDSTIAKIWGVAVEYLDQSKPPKKTPEYSFGRYQFRDIDHWTAGFFPGSLYCLLERCNNYPSRFPTDKVDRTKLEYAARWWAEGLFEQAPRRDTHDLGFIIQPAFQREYEYSKSSRSFDCLVTAAEALASRFDETVGFIRSWDSAVNKRYNITNKNTDFIVIIDNMCNLDMLYYVASKTGDLRLSTIATTHAEVTLKNHFRDPEWSSFHVVNYDLKDGSVKAKITNQGYADETTWSRGQSWAILGFIETYSWTKQRKFLEASVGLAKYFVSKLPDDGVPAWDFGAPDKDIKDTSAAMICALGLIKIYEATNDSEYLISGLKLVSNTISFAYTNESSFRKDGTVDLGDRDTILANATINNNPDTYERLVNHGLVYADYYFLAIGNKLLQLGLIQ